MIAGSAGSRGTEAAIIGPVFRLPPRGQYAGHTHVSESAFWFSYRAIGYTAPLAALQGENWDLTSEQFDVAVLAVNGGAVSGLLSHEYWDHKAASMHSTYGCEGPTVVRSLPFSGE